MKLCFLWRENPSYRGEEELGAAPHTFAIILCYCYTRNFPVLHSLSSSADTQNIVKQILFFFFWKKNSTSTAVLFMTREHLNLSLGSFPYEAKEIKQL